MLVVKELINTSNRIDKITHVISGIAKETNLLSLNAAIEAARSGEHGKGFTIVAGEIRKLAQETEDATQEISKLVRQAKEWINKTAAEVNNTERIVLEQEAAVEKTSGSFSFINQAVGRVAEQFNQIVNFTDKLRNDSKEVETKIESIVAVVQMNSANTQEVAASIEEQSASMEQIAASCEELGRMAKKLQQAIGKFKI